MQWLRRLLMDPYERTLKDPAAYRAPLDRDQIRQEVQALGVRDHECRDALESAVHEINAGGSLTIAAVADSYQDRHYTAQHNSERSVDDCLKLGAIGAEMLLNFLIRRANRLADEIKPGAQALLADKL